MEAFQFKTVPHQHQLAEFELSKDMISRALWWEPGCGKTKPCIDTAAHLYLMGEIDALVAIAPNGVHENWAWEEIPIHMPDAVMDVTKVFLWRTKKRHNVGYARELDEFLEHKGFKVLCLSYDSLMTDDSARIVKRFFEKHRCMYVVDEADKIKTPGAAVTKRVLASSAWAKYRRTLSGTPVDDSPLDIYTQAKFADPMVWTRLGLGNFSAFKTFFSEWELRETREGRQFPSLVRFRNLDKLQEVILSLGSRLQKKDVLDLPEKQYETIRFELAGDQKRMHDELKRDYQAWFGDGSRVTAELALTRMLRMQQLTSGYLPADDEEQLRPLAGENARLKALSLALERVGDTKTIIWCKYTIDVDEIAKELLRLGKSFVVYDGRTKAEDRYDAKNSFQKGDVQFFLGKASAAGRGLTLHSAKFAIFYNNTFRLLERRQAEDRCHRAGMNAVSPVYIDIVAKGTVDEYIQVVLRKKRSTAAYVMGDDLPAWM